MANLLPAINTCFLHRQLPLNQHSSWVVSGVQNFIQIVKMFNKYSNKELLKKKDILSVNVYLCANHC